MVQFYFHRLLSISIPKFLFNSKSDQPIYDTVRSGEGGRQLAERNGLTLEELLALNPGIETSVFYPGQSLRIK